MERKSDPSFLSLLKAISRNWQLYTMHTAERIALNALGYTMAQFSDEARSAQST